MKWWHWALILLTSGLALVAILYFAFAKARAEGEFFTTAEGAKARHTPWGVVYTDPKGGAQENREEVGPGGATFTVTAPRGFATGGPGWLVQSTIPEEGPGGYTGTKTEALNMVRPFVAPLGQGKWGDGWIAINALQPMRGAWAYRRISWKPDEAHGKVITDELALYDEFGVRVG